MAATVPALKAALISRLGSADDATKQAAFADAVAQWLVNDVLPAIKATIPASAIVTTGSAATQTGPAAPLQLTVT